MNKYNFGKITGIIMKQENISIGIEETFYLPYIHNYFIQISEPKMKSSRLSKVLISYTDFSFLFADDVIVQRA